MHKKRLTYESLKALSILWAILPNFRFKVQKCTKTIGLRIFICNVTHIKLVNMYKFYLLMYNVHLGVPGATLTWSEEGRLICVQHVFLEVGGIQGCLVTTQLGGLRGCPSIGWWKGPREGGRRLAKRARGGKKIKKGVHKKGHYCVTHVNSFQ